MSNGTRSNPIHQGPMLDLIQRGESFTYALLTKHGAVKIGITRNLARRKTAMAYGGFDHFLAFAPGDFDDELAIHHAMPDDVRLPGRREYYYPLYEFVLPPINDMRAALGLPGLDRTALPRTGFWARHLPVADGPVSWPWPKPWTAAA